MRRNTVKTNDDRKNLTTKGGNGPQNPEPLAPGPPINQVPQSLQQAPQQKSNQEPDVMNNISPIYSENINIPSGTPGTQQQPSEEKVTDGGGYGISKFAALLVGGVLFLLFSIVKSVDVGKSLMGAEFSDWVRVWFNTSVILLKLTSQAVLYLFVLFIGFTLLILAVVYILSTLQVSDKDGKMAKFDAVAVLKTMARVFLGYFAIDDSINTSVIVLPIFIAIFAAVFAATMWKPNQTAEDTNKEAIETTMKHYFLMIILLLHFAAIVTVLLRFMSE